jgi:hypothetical protein
VNVGEPNVLRTFAVKDVELAPKFAKAKAGPEALVDGMKGMGIKENGREVLFVYEVDWKTKISLAEQEGDAGRRKDDSAQPSVLVRLRSPMITKFDDASPVRFPPT